MINTLNAMIVVRKVNLLYTYGWAMSQYLQYSGFKRLNREEIKRFDVNSIEKNSPIGYILEIDLEYPDELPELHND